MATFCCKYQVMIWCLVAICECTKNDNVHALAHDIIPDILSLIPEPDLMKLSVAYPGIQNMIDQIVLDRINMNYALIFTQKNSTIHPVDIRDRFKYISSCISISKLLRINNFQLARGYVFTKHSANSITSCMDCNLLPFISMKLKFIEKKNFDASFTKTVIFIFNPDGTIISPNLDPNSTVSPEFIINLIRGDSVHFDKYFVYLDVAFNNETTQDHTKLTVNYKSITAGCAFYLLFLVIIISCFT